MKSSTLIEPGKLQQVDYRVFKFTIELGFEDRLEHGYTITDLIHRINEYFYARPGLSYSHELMGIVMIIQFEKLDDAKMFMLAFSDVLETQGYKYE